MPGAVLVEAAEAEIADGRHGPAVALARETKTAPEAKVATTRELLARL